MRQEAIMKICPTCKRLFMAFCLACLLAAHHGPHVPERLSGASQVRIVTAGVAVSSGTNITPGTGELLATGWAPKIRIV